MESERVTFPNARGERLAGQIEWPVTSKARVWALFAHCFTCTRNSRAARTISRALAEHGVGVLRFDFTGLGDSEGDFADTNFSSNVDDLIAAAAYLEREHAAPALLVGHSLGGAAVLRAAADIASSRAVVTIGAPSDPAHVTRLLKSSEAQIEREGEAVVALAGRPFRIKKQFLEDLRRSSPSETLRGLERALLVMHAPGDAIVPIDNAAQIFTAARHPKSFVSLDDADHLLSREADARYAASVLASWADRYVDVAAGEGPAHRAGEGEVVARTEAGLLTELDVGGHALLADEPARVGGTNRGPTPYGLLSAALAACTTMTLRMYADRKQWPLAAVAVHVRHDKIHAKDCEACESSQGRVDRFERRLVLEGDLEASQRERLREIADRCPVHRTLHGEVTVQTRLEGDDA